MLILMKKYIVLILYIIFYMLLFNNILCLYILCLISSLNVPLGGHVKCETLNLPQIFQLCMSQNADRI